MLNDPLTLETVKFSNLLSMRIPGDWNVETRPDWDWCCALPNNETGTLYVKVHRWERGDGPRIDPHQTIEAMAAEFAARQDRPPLETSISPLGDAYLWRYVANAQEGDELLRIYRYDILQGGDPFLALVQFNFVILEARADHPDIRDMIVLVDREIRAAKFTLFPDAASELPNLSELQTITCEESMSLRVPARWDFNTDLREEEGWSCYRKGEETGTLWISIRRHLRPDASGDPDFTPRSWVDWMVDQRLTNRSMPAIGSKIVECPLGYLWSYSYDSVEDGQQLHNYRYIFFLFADTEFAIVNFDFVVLKSQLKDGEIRGLIETVDREIRAANLTVLSDAARARGAFPFALPHRMNFGDQVEVSFPDSLKVTTENDTSWYCYFEDNAITASMYIMTSDHRMSDSPFDKDGAVPDEVIEALARHFIDDPSSLTDSTLFPRGFLAYSIYDDPEDSEPSAVEDPTDWRKDGFRHHLWRSFYIGEAVVRQAQFLLMLPVKQPDTRPLKSLVKILDRQIREAEFPGL